MLKISYTFIFFGIMFIICGYFINLHKPNYTQSQKPCLYVSANLLNVREKPNLDSTIISKLPQNYKICNYEYENEFLKLENGYISANYVNTSKIQKEIKKIAKNESKKITLTSTKDNIRKKADEYFELNDYVGAMNLALTANKQDPSNKDSWEIFSKSIYMQGNKDEAINVLKIFLSYNYDESLQELLNQMERGNNLPRE